MVYARRLDGRQRGEGRDRRGSNGWVGDEGGVESKRGVDMSAFETEVDGLQSDPRWC